MTAENAEDVFVNTFVEPSKRARYSSLLRSKKGRAKILDALNHWADADGRFLKRISASAQNSAEIGRLLRAKQSPEAVHVISANPRIDSQVLPLTEALDATIAMGYGTVLVCIPERLAYFESEEPGERYILERRP